MLDVDGLYSAYLIATAIANKTKTKFYSTDLVHLENVCLLPVFLSYFFIHIFFLATSCVLLIRPIIWARMLIDVPEAIQTRLVIKFTKILLHAQALQMSHLDALKNQLAGVELTLNEVNPSMDEDLYIEYNIRPFSPPSDWKFEPCVNFYDTVSALLIIRILN